MSQTSWLAVALGSILILAFLGLDQTAVGIQITYVVPWTNSTSGELFFLLGMIVFAFPGAMLIAWGVAPIACDRLYPIWRYFDNLSSKQKAVFLLLTFSLVLNLAMLGNALVLLGYPLTDDEWAAKYGGQLLAEGKLMEPVPPYFQIIPKLFFYVRDGMMTSFDYLGAQLPWAFAELTHTDNLIFAVFVALSCISVTGVVAIYLKPAWGLIACSLFLFSPMAASLSVTTHVHVISRGLIAVSLLTLTLADKRSSSRLWLLTGFIAGLAMISRPLGIFALLFPLFVLVVVNAIKGSKNDRLKLGLLVLGAVIPVILMFLHSLAVTGTIFPARFAPNEVSTSEITKAPLSFLYDYQVLWQRFGSNLGYNLLHLIIWSMGILTLPLAIIGFFRNNFAKALGIGIGLHFLLALLHDDPGLHIVGPIHYSETVVPVLILATFGMYTVSEWLRRHGLESRRLLFTLVIGTLLGSIIFNAMNFTALRRQAFIHDSIYGLFERAEFENAVILSPSYGAIWMTNPQYSRIGSFVFSWRRIAPDDDKKPVFVHDTDDPQILKALKERYQDRSFYQITLSGKSPHFTITRLTSLLPE